MLDNLEISLKHLEMFYHHKTFMSNFSRFPSHAAMPPATVLRFPPDGAGAQGCRIQHRHVMISTEKHRRGAWNAKVQVKPCSSGDGIVTSTIAGWFLLENAMKMDDLGVPLFQENVQICAQMS